MAPHTESVAGITVSVILCCYNSADRLAETLRHLSLLEIPPHHHCEVVVVDNACTDGSAGVAQTLWSGYGAPFDLVLAREPVPGLSHARRRGVSVARGEYFVFCDDDNWLDAKYLIHACRILDADQGIGGLGGCSLPVLEPGTDYPAWFPACAAGYAVGEQAPQNGPLSAGSVLWGAGLVLRGALLKRLYAQGVRQLLPDRVGTDLSAGGDSEICLWYQLAGLSLVYDNRLVLRHYLPASRLTQEYLERLHRGVDASHRILRAYAQWGRVRSARRNRLRNPLMWLAMEVRFRWASCHLPATVTRIESVVAEQNAGLFG